MVVRVMVLSQSAPSLAKSRRIPKRRKSPLSGQMHGFPCCRRRRLPGPHQTLLASNVAWLMVCRALIIDAAADPADSFLENMVSSMVMLPAFVDRTSLCHSTVLFSTEGAAVSRNRSYADRPATASASSRRTCCCRSRPSLALALKIAPPGRRRPCATFSENVLSETLSVPCSSSDMAPPS